MNVYYIFLLLLVSVQSASVIVGDESNFAKLIADNEFALVKL